MILGEWPAATVRNNSGHDLPTANPHQLHLSVLYTPGTVSCIIISSFNLNFFGWLIIWWWSSLCQPSSASSLSTLPSRYCFLLPQLYCSVNLISFGWFINCYLLFALLSFIRWSHSVSRCRPFLFQFYRRLIVPDENRATTPILSTLISIFPSILILYYTVCSSILHFILLCRVDKYIFLSYWFK